MKPYAHRDLQGFTLLELLVALAIMALSLGLLYRASGSGARGVADLERYQRAVIVAQSLLSTRDAVSEGGWNEAGISAGYDWQVSSAPYPTPLSGPNIPMLHEVRVVVSWSEGGRMRQLELGTLLPQRRPPDPGARS